MKKYIFLSLFALCNPVFASDSEEEDYAYIFRCAECQKRASCNYALKFCSNACKMKHQKKVVDWLANSSKTTKQAEDRRT